MAPQPLSVGLNLVYLVRDSGGAGRYARELIRAMLDVEPATRITAFVSTELPRDVLEEDWAPAVDFVRLPVTVTHGPPWNMGSVMRAQWGAVPLHARRRRLDVVHGLANVAPLAGPKHMARVVTLLDLIWIHYPKTMARRATIGMKLVAPTSARRADRVIAISEAARDDLVQTLGLPRDKIDVTPLGIRTEARTVATPEADLRERLGLGASAVVLCVAQKREHKNLSALIRALALLRDQDVRLVLPGAPTPHEQGLRELAASLGVASRVVFPEWLDESDLEGLYALARCFVLPSFEEGFGLPILEAMQRGVPVATSNVSSLPEVAGDAALLFDPHRPQDIAAAIERLLPGGSAVEELVARGRQRCEHFTWHETARATLASYRRAIAQRRRA